MAVSTKHVWTLNKPPLEVRLPTVAQRMSYGIMSDARMSAAMAGRAFTYRSAWAAYRGVTRTDGTLGDVSYSVPHTDLRNDMLGEVIIL